jgi:beta-lactam-binding protein with PASTA domain
MRGYLVVAVISLGACQLPPASPRTSFRTPAPAPAPAPTPAAQSAIVAMPDLTLMSRAEAEAALRRAGFTHPPDLDRTSICGSTLDDRKTIIELDRVCYQHPVPGAQTRTSLPVTIRVQTEDPRRGELGGGRAWFLMPDVIGLDVAAASARIRALGYTGKDVEIEYRDDCKPDIVCRTHHEAWTRTPTTAVQVFYVGRDPAKQPPPPPATPPPTPTPTPTPSPTTSTDIF